MTRLDIFSDPICPWCYIGLARLRAGIEAAGGNPFEVTWRPFMLNPDMPVEGMDRRAYLAAKFGADRVDEIYGVIEETAQAEGLDVDFSKPARTPNTIDAHRIIRWAQTEGVADALHWSLFDRFFRLGEDLSDHDVLVAAAAEAGMDETVTRRLLSSDADRAEIVAEDRAAREMGVTAVPTFLIGGQFVVQGAQEAKTWRGIVEQLTAAVGP